MKNNPIFCKVILILFLSVLFCYSQQNEPSQQIINKLEKVQQTMINAAIDGDYNTAINMYTEDAIIMADFKPALRGKKAIMKQFNEDQKRGVKMHSINANVELRWQADSEIYERGTFGMAISSRTEKKPKAYYGSYFQIWEIQKDGTPKIKFNIWNLDFNPY